MSYDCPDFVSDILAAALRHAIITAEQADPDCEEDETPSKQSAAIENGIAAMALKIEQQAALLAEDESFIAGFEGDDTQDSSIDPLLERLRATNNPTGPLRVIVHLEGGLVQSVSTDNPALLGISAYVIDYDIDGADELSDVPQALEFDDYTERVEAVVSVLTVTQANVGIDGITNAEKDGSRL